MNIQKVLIPNCDLPSGIYKILFKINNKWIEIINQTIFKLPWTEQRILADTEYTVEISIEDGIEFINKHIGNDLKFNNDILQYLGEV